MTEGAQASGQAGDGGGEAAWRPPASLRTARLELRSVRLSDAAAVFTAYAQDPAVTRYLDWRPHRSVSETRAFLAHCEALWGAGRAFAYVLADPDGGQAMGMLQLLPQGSQAVLGFVLARPRWGQGLMSEALAALLGWARGPAGPAALVATCDLENAASARVLTKAGFTLQGLLPRQAVHPALGAEPRDLHLYRLRLRPQDGGS